MGRKNFYLTMESKATIIYFSLNDKEYKLYQSLDSFEQLAFDHRNQMKLFRELSNQKHHLSTDQKAQLDLLEQVLNL